MSRQSISSATVVPSILEDNTERLLNKSTDDPSHLEEKYCNTDIVCDNAITEAAENSSAAVISGDLVLKRSLTAKLCGAAIRIILPHTGHEEDEYWNWVLSTKPTLPSEFLKGFKTASKKLSEDSVAETKISTDSLASHHESLSVTTINPRPRPNRGSTWAPTLTKRASAYKLEVSGKQESCLIL
ncbi:unnamed protein product [Phytophthora fragariaefolia]|uniref:Unnamed protein product n=1 Tax=Phytophthora fragariaefolia TaxID=1490495 RepID=A0A9W7D6J3_9STRA|nr:unnamed protein product [Phytophthora fragariaefolia]